MEGYGVFVGSGRQLVAWFSDRHLAVSFASNRKLPGWTVEPLTITVNRDQDR